VEAALSEPKCFPLKKNKSHRLTPPKNRPTSISYVHLPTENFPSKAVSQFLQLCPIDSILALLVIFRGGRRALWIENRLVAKHYKYRRSTYIHAPCFFSMTFSAPVPLALAPPTPLSRI
jgi:hypothetical protein